MVALLRDWARWAQSPSPVRRPSCAPTRVVAWPHFRSLSSTRSALLAARYPPGTREGSGVGRDAGSGLTRVRPALPAELFAAPVLKAGRAGAGEAVLRCETRLHPRRRAVPLQFAFYKHSRVVRRFEWAAEYRVPEAEAGELEAHWCEAATASRSVRKRSAWPQLPGRGERPPPPRLCTRPAPAPAPALPGRFSLTHPFPSPFPASPVCVHRATRRFGRHCPGSEGRAPGAREPAAFLPKVPAAHDSSVGHSRP